MADSECFLVGEDDLQDGANSQQIWNVFLFANYPIFAIH